MGYQLITKTKPLEIILTEKIQNAEGFLIQIRQFYYKMQQLLQNATFITNWHSTNITFNKSKL